jgi:hypothetical protein
MRGRKVALNAQPSSTPTSDQIQYKIHHFFQKTITFQTSLKNWTMNKELDVDSAINLLKSGGKLDEIIISDLATSKVLMMDALLLARNGYIVPEDNVVYDDAQIQYDPDFDDVAWGQPVPFKKLIPSLESGDPLTEKAELVVKLQIKSADMKLWLANNEDQINMIVSGLIESMYRADKIAKP